jgi:hypothetical protein
MATSLLQLFARLRDVFLRTRAREMADFERFMHAQVLQ